LPEIRSALVPWTNYVEALVTGEEKRGEAAAFGRASSRVSTGHCHIPPGSRSVAQILKDLGRGFVITDFIGGNSNSTTGDASIGIGGYLFENGVRTQAVPR